MASRFVSSIFKGGEVSDFWILMHQLGKNIIGEFVTPKTLDLDDLKFEDHAKGIKCCCQEESEQLYVFYSRFSPTNQHMIRQLILDRLNKKIKNTSVFSSLWMFMVNTKITYHTKLGVSTFCQHVTCPWSTSALQGWCWRPYLPAWIWYDGKLYSYIVLLGTDSHHLSSGNLR